MQIIKEWKDIVLYLLFHLQFLLSLSPIQSRRLRLQITPDIAALTKTSERHYFLLHNQHCWWHFQSFWVVCHWPPSFSMRCNFLRCLCSPIVLLNVVGEQAKPISQSNTIVRGVLTRLNMDLVARGGSYTTAFVHCRHWSRRDCQQCCSDSASALQAHAPQATQSLIDPCLSVFLYLQDRGGMYQASVLMAARLQSPGPPAMYMAQVADVRPCYPSGRQPKMSSRSLLVWHG